MTNPAGQGADANADDDDSNHDIPRSDASDGVPPLDKQLTPATIDQGGDATNIYVPGTEPANEDSRDGELAFESFGGETNDVPMPAKLGKYHIKGQIGRGGMGIVWKALDPDLQRTVAIKILRPHLAQSAVARRRFLREARAAAAINHPNVLTIHSVEEQGDMPFLVMEFVSGNSLREYVTERKKLDALEVIRLGTQIALGLAAAHAGGVIHRDVKPANVMLHEGATRVRLMDFGLARVAFDNADLTSHDHTVGTPAYMAPEQVRGSQIDARADLFSLGCVLYYMATGYSPFRGKSQAETIHKILDLVPVTLAQMFPGTSPVLSELVEKLLAKNPDDRFQSSLEVADILRRLQSELNLAQTDEVLHVLNDRTPLVATPISAVITAKPPATSRSRVAALLVSLVVVVAGVFAMWQFWLGGSSTIPLGAVPPAAHGANTGINTDGHNTPPVAKLLTEITVGPGPEATCATLAEAIRRADENCTITVVGPGPYSESLVIDRPELRGLRLIAQPRAQLKPSQSPGGEPKILSIEDVSNVTLEGFDFELAGESNHAMTITGKARDITVSDCKFTHSGLSGSKSLVFVNTNTTDPTGTILLRRCQFATLGGAYCVSAGAADTRMSPTLACENCLFSAPYTQFYATESCQRIRLAGNVFFKGENAINLNLKTWSSDSRVEIVNNTFMGSHYWLGFYESFRPEPFLMGQTTSRVCNNLILGGDGGQAGLDQLQLVEAKWRFDANWLEPTTDTATTEDHGSHLVTFHPRLDIPFRDDPRHDQFLVPAPGSPLLTGGVGGDLPGHIGARVPPAMRSKTGSE